MQTLTFDPQQPREELARLLNILAPRTADITASTTLTLDSHVVRADATGGAITVIPPPAAQVPGQIFIVKRTNSGANAVTLDPNGSEAIDGASTVALGTQYATIGIQSNGTNYDRLFSNTLSALLGNITYAQMPTGSGTWDTGASTVATITRALTVLDLLTVGTATGTGAAFRVDGTVTGISGTTQRGILCQPTLTSGATSAAEGMAVRAVGGANGSPYTTTTERAIHVLNSLAGTNQTITTSVGLEIDTQSAGSTNISIRTGASINSFGGQSQGPAGSAGTPPWSFSTDPDTGIYSGGTNILGFATNGTARGSITATGSWVLGTAALATTATDGFAYIPSCAGTPTGTPTAITGLVPLVYDSTNNILYAYSGAWRAH